LYLFATLHLLTFLPLNRFIREPFCEERALTFDYNKWHYKK
jgi:hypothetical protein